MSKGKTASHLRLSDRRLKAAELFTQGYSVTQVARELKVTAETARRYRDWHEEQVHATARSNPTFLRDVITNTTRALEELDLVRARAWERANVRNASDEVQARMMSIILNAQEQRNKLFGILGVKPEFAAHVQRVREQQDRLIVFMQANLCPTDRAKLEEFLMEEFNAELATMPTAAGH